MKITKKNGNTTMYDDEKVVCSILRANAEVPEEECTPVFASRIADAVFCRLTAEYEVISTKEIRECLAAILRERGLPLTAQRYLDYDKENRGR